MILHLNNSTNETIIVTVGNNNPETIQPSEHKNINIADKVTEIKLSHSYSSSAKFTFWNIFDIFSDTTTTNTEFVLDTLYQIAPTSQDVIDIVILKDVFRLNYGDSYDRLYIHNALQKGLAKYEISNKDKLRKKILWGQVISSTPQIFILCLIFFIIAIIQYKKTGSTTFSALDYFIVFGGVGLNAYWLIKGINNALRLMKHDFIEKCFSREIPEHKDFDIEDIGNIFKKK